MLLTRCWRGSFPQAPFTKVPARPKLLLLICATQWGEDDDNGEVDGPDLEAGTGPLPTTTPTSHNPLLQYLAAYPPRRTGRHREDRGAWTRPCSSISISCLHLTWQQSIRRGGAVMNPNCSLFTTLQGVSMQICPERYLVYARPTVWTEMWAGISLRQKPWWGDAGIIIHLDKLFILHMALLSAGQSAAPHT